MAARGGSWLTSSEALDPGFASPHCHATTIAQTDQGLVLSFFGGETTDRQDLWVMHHGPGGWGTAEQVAAQTDYTDRYWNPVLHQVVGGPLLLFFKQGSNCAFWEGYRSVSDDAGRTWSKPEKLPKGIFGPVRNKPIELDDGSLLCPSSTELGGWHVHFERYSEQSEEWWRTDSVPQTEEFGAIQPTLLHWPSGRIQALCRTKVGCVAQTFSEDEGRTWTPLERTELPNPNSAIDAVMLRDGRAALVYNPVASVGGIQHASRTPLSIATSQDGERWAQVAVLEDADDEFSYPAAIVTRDGKLHVTYTAGRGWTGMRHVVVDPEGL